MLSLDVLVSTVQINTSAITLNIASCGTHTFLSRITETKTGVAVLTVDNALVHIVAGKVNIK